MATSMDTVTLPRDTGKSSSRKLFLLSLLFAITLSAVLSICTRDIGVTWDEPLLLQSANKILEFSKQLRLEGGLKQFSDDKVVPYFPTYNRFLYEHPTVTRAIGASGLALFGRMEDELFAYRMGNILLTSCAAALVFFVISLRFQNKAIGFLTAMVCVTMPRVTGQMQLGDTDTCLYALSFPAAMAGYVAATRGSKKWAFLCATLCGACIAAKFTGLIITLAIFVWTFIYYREKKGAYTLFFIPLVAPVVFVILNPAYWHDPLLRTLLFFARSSSRHLTERHWGYMFDFFDTTPWYYPPIMILATIPLVSLALIFFGLAKVVKNRFRDDLAGLFAFLAALPILALLMPNTVAYNGVRLFLVSFLYLGIFSAWTFKHYEKWLDRKSVILTLSAVLIAPCFFAHPFELEYYGAQVGGTVGAAKLGLEATYWWDAANPEFYRKANEILSSSSQVAMFPADSAFLDFYKKHQFLKGSLVEPKKSDHMVVLCMPSCTAPQLAESVGQWYESPRRVLSYPSTKVPFVILLQRQP